MKLPIPIKSSKTPYVLGSKFRVSIGITNKDDDFVIKLEMPKLIVSLKRFFRLNLI